MYSRTGISRSSTAISEISNRMLPASLLIASEFEQIMVMPKLNIAMQFACSRVPQSIKVF
jgi:hypothetical protein